jgi:hypothetical protein
MRLRRLRIFMAEIICSFMRCVSPVLHYAPSLVLSGCIPERQSRCSVRLGTQVNAGHFPDDDLLMISSHSCTETGFSEGAPEL